MKTSKIREQLSYRKYRTYNYVAELPSQEKWLVEHVSGTHDIETLRKPIDFKDVGKPSYDEVEWFDKFGAKSSNVDYILIQMIMSFIRLLMKSLIVTMKIMI